MKSAQKSCCKVAYVSAPPSPQCYREHNRAVNGSTPQYPLCAMQLFSHMSAVTDTATCMRRSEIPFSLTPGTCISQGKSLTVVDPLSVPSSFCSAWTLEFVCDPLGDENIWASTKPLNNTAKGHKEGESVVIAAVKVSFHFHFIWLVHHTKHSQEDLLQSCD